MPTSPETLLSTVLLSTDPLQTQSGVENYRATWWPGCRGVENYRATWWPEQWGVENYRATWWPGYVHVENYRATGLVGLVMCPKSVPERAGG